MAKKSGGQRKHDRNRAWCQAYRAAGKREKSKARRLLRQIARQPNDRSAREAYDALPAWAKREHREAA